MLEDNTAEMTPFATKKGPFIEERHDPKDLGPNHPLMFSIKYADVVTMERVEAYFEHIHAGNAPPQIEKPLRSNNFEDCTTPFYANLVHFEGD